MFQYLLCMQYPAVDIHKKHWHGRSFLLFWLDVHCTMCLAVWMWSLHTSTLFCLISHNTQHLPSIVVTYCVCFAHYMQHVLSTALTSGALSWTRWRRNKKQSSRWSSEMDGHSSSQPAGLTTTLTLMNTRATYVHWHTHIPVFLYSSLVSGANKWREHGNMYTP